MRDYTPKLIQQENTVPIWDMDPSAIKSLFAQEALTDSFAFGASITEAQRLGQGLHVNVLDNSVLVGSLELQTPIRLTTYSRDLTYHAWLTKRGGSGLLVLTCEPLPDVGMPFTHFHGIVTGVLARWKTISSVIAESRFILGQEEEWSYNGYRYFNFPPNTKSPIGSSGFFKRYIPQHQH